jgi:hypothetical protein
MNHFTWSKETAIVRKFNGIDAPKMSIQVLAVEGIVITLPQLIINEGLIRRNLIERLSSEQKVGCSQAATNTGISLFIHFQGLPINNVCLGHCWKTKNGWTAVV